MGSSPQGYTDVDIALENSRGDADNTRPAPILTIRLAGNAGSGPDHLGEACWIIANHPAEAEALPPSALSPVQFSEFWASDIARRRDLLVVLDTEPVEATHLAAMRRAASADPMIGFVVPVRGAEQPDDDATRPRYAPAAAGSRVFIRYPMAEEFGGLDLARGDAAAALTDLMARANRSGYRVVAAAIGGRPAIFSTQIDARHPEVARDEARRAASPEAVADALMLGLRPTAENRLRVAFDCTSLTEHHAGTSEATRHIVARTTAAWSDRFELHVICSHDVFRFHDFNTIPDLSWTPPDAFTPAFAAVIRIGQLFSREALAHLRRRAPVQILTMLDTIALDCAYLDDPDLQRLWQDGANATDALVFISDFARRQFERRFRLPHDVIVATSLLSMDPADYGHPTPGGGEERILVVGNQFAHKAVREAALALATLAAPGSIVLLGHPTIREAGIQGYVSGQLTNFDVDRLYSEARCVLYPSHYEGFGFPLMHALARHKPVVARDLPPFREIVEATGMGANVHLRTTTREMVALAASSDLTWQDHPGHDLSELGWSRCAADYRKVLELALASFDVANLKSRVAVAQAAGREHEGEASIEREKALREEFDAAKMGYAAAAADFRSVETAFVASEALFLADEQAASDFIAALQKDQARLKAELTSVVASASWRITAPLRKLASALKALRGT